MLVRAPTGGLGLGLLILAVAGAGACGGGPAGPLPQGLYVLRTVDDEPLPVTRTFEHGPSLTLLADTLHLGEDGRYVRRGATRFVDVDGDATRQAFRMEGEVERADELLVLAFECEDTGSSSVACVPPDTILSVGEELVLRSFVPLAGLKRFESRR